MAYNRRTFTLDAQSESLLHSDALAEGINESELVRRRILLGSLLVEACRRIPGSGRDRFARIAVLPESAPQPEGSEVMRIFVGHPATDGRSRPPRPEQPTPVRKPTPMAPAPDEPESLLVHRRDDTADLNLEYTLDGDGNPLPFTVRTICGHQVDATLATGDAGRVDCPQCLTNTPTP